MRCLVLHLLFLILVLLSSGTAYADGKIIIRDAEIETMLKDWSAPVIRAAGLDLDAVNIVLVQSPETNAFVAGGQNIFLYTGLLQKTDDPGEVIGVIAHELGHIAGGHLVRGRAMMERTSYETMLGTILGIGVAVATGSGEAGMAVSGGALGLAQRNYLAFSRVQESSADQAGLRFLKSARINPSGLVTFMEKLANQELLAPSQQNEYVRTHPISRDRVEVLESSLAGSDLRTKLFPAKWVEGHARLKAKLLGFMTPEQVAWVYPENDHSVAADYARVIANYRQNNVDAALTGADALITREPKNAYFYELKGQILYDFGRAAASIPPYARAVDLAPRAPLIRLAYAQALIADPSVTPVGLKNAAKLLEQVRDDEPRNTRLYRLLGTVYGQLQDDGAAQAMLAEEAFLKGQFSESRRLAEGAVKQLPNGSRHRRGVLDLLEQLDQHDKKKKDE